MYQIRSTRAYREYNMYSERSKLLADLKIFLSITTTLAIIGLLFIYSSSSIFALEKHGIAHYFVLRQLKGLLLGIIGLITLRFLPLTFIKKGSPFFFFGSLLLTLLTLIRPFVLRIHGSSRWLNLGGFAFQPSELLKMTLIIYVAYFLTKKERKIGSFTQGYLPFLTIIGITCLVLLKQPDFGLTVTLAATVFMLLFIAQFRAKHLLLTLCLALPGILGLIYFFPYRLKRIMTFLNPWDDPQGAGFQIIQSLIAIGSGSLWGSGIAASKQKFFYLPMQHTDFIFSIIAEETGFIGASLLIMLYMLFLYFGIRLAWNLKNAFATFTTLGFVILMSLQALINISVATGLIPTKGIGLPFISYGSSSLACSVAMLGLIINFVHECRS
jgi:cell division protein FtsW